MSRLWSELSCRPYLRRDCRDRPAELAELAHRQPNGGSLRRSGYLSQPFGRRGHMYLSSDVIEASLQSAHKASPHA